MAGRIGQQFVNYRLVTLLGQGGYAEVYLGQHVRLELQAAIKVLHTHLTDQEVEHFQQEAQTIAKLTHPSIVRVFDFDVQNGVPFLVMDYAPNGSLRHRYPKGSLVPLPQIISSVKQVVAALQYAHEHKFIHRDVKPENMLVGRHEEVLLSDFGLAALAHSSASLSTQEAIGTLPYMAPEQIEGHPRAASDQYALGVVVYEWLCGSRPFEGSATEVMVQHLTMPPPPLHERSTTIRPEVEQVVLRALAKDPKERFVSVHDFATALEQASQLAPSSPMLLATELPAPGAAPATSYATVVEAPSPPGVPMEATPEASLPVGAFEPTVYPGSTPPADLAISQPGQVVTPQTATTPVPAVVPRPLEPTIPVRQRGIRRLPRIKAGLLMGLAVLIVTAGVLSSLNLLTHLGVFGAHSNTTTLTPVRGGTWTDNFFYEPDSFIPGASTGVPDTMADQALYLPLFYGDAQGVIHAGAASEVPTVQNGGISADAKTWTFHLCPGLKWSDGQPLDARDVDFSWKLWINPKFPAASTIGFNLITSTTLSPDNLSITFHLKQAFSPFLSIWMDGGVAPLPAHVFSSMAPDKILTSPDNLNPRVTSGPFKMSESVPGDHYTLVRNLNYYRAHEGLPYLDKVVIRTALSNVGILKNMQAGTIDSAWYLDPSQVQKFQRYTHYTLTTNATIGSYEALWFNFHNVILATHPEVRQAIAMAIDHRTLITTALHGFGEPLCTDHGSAYHPGYQPNAECPELNPVAANHLLDDNGWVKSPDGVRVSGGQRLEFEYSTTANNTWRNEYELIIQRNLNAIGIKLDIQNYPVVQFFSSFLPGGKASPPTGAVAGRYDIAEFSNNSGYDPDDSSLLSCDQFPPKGYNIDFYCKQTLDALYQQEQATADPGLRQQIFDQIHRIYLTEFPFIVLNGEEDLGIVRKGTHNYLPGPLGASGTINIWEWWCDNGKC